MPRVALPGPPSIRVALCVGQWLPPSETFIYDQVISQERTEIYVLARGRGEHANRFPYERVTSLGPTQRASYFHLGVAPSVPWFLKRRRVQVIHAHFGLNATMVLPYARRLGIPLVATFHGHDVGGLEPQNAASSRYGRYQKLAPALFDYASLLLCASRELADRLLEHGAPPKRVVVHHLGIDLARFSPPCPKQKRENTIVMVGRLVEKKGMFDGIRAFAEATASHGDWRLEIIGEGPLRSRLERSAREFGVSDRVIFRGVLDREQVQTAMRSASFLMAPSFTTASGDRESGVIVLKEAGACGLPTIGTHHGGIPEIIEEGCNGFLIPQRDTRALADRIARLIRSEQERITLGNNARKLIEERYDARTLNQRLESYLADCAHQAGAISRPPSNDERGISGVPT